MYERQHSLHVAMHGMMPVNAVPYGKCKRQILFEPHETLSRSSIDTPSCHTSSKKTPRILDSLAWVIPRTARSTRITVAKDTERLISAFEAQY
jgi:hypothetical protein